MKIYICSVIVSFNLTVFAQCNNQVVTDPTSTPSNLALPDVDNLNNSPDSRYLNGFNWWAEGSYQLTNMQYNPNQPYNYISNIQDPNCNSNYAYLVKELGAEEMNPQNGWELLLVNLGRFPDNLNPTPTSPLSEIPYIGLYNKYTGKLRLFVQHGYNQPPATAVDGLKITVFYNTVNNPGNKSTILRLANGKDNTLDQLNTLHSITAICPPNGSAVSQWMSADFQLTYDPCVCNIPTNLSVSFSYFSETDFKMFGRSLSVEDDLIVNGQIANQDFLSGVSTDNENGYIIYEKMQTMADDYISKMGAYQDQLEAIGEYNEQVDKKLLAIKIFKQVVNLGLLAATGTTGFSQFALAWPAINFKKVVNGVTVIDTSKSKKFYGKVEEILGEYAKTFISESLKKKENPTKPVMPMVTLTEMTFSGTLSNIVDAPSLLFSTPGSFKNSTSINDLPLGNPQGYPVYNQPLGVFALLEAPSISQSKYSQISTTACIDQYGNIPNPEDPFQDTYFYFGKKIFRQTENKSQFKLKSPLVYTFNPGLAYKSKSVSAMYVIKTKVKENNKGIAPINNEGNTNTYYRSKIYDASVNLNSSTINTYNNEVIWDYENANNWINGGEILKKVDSLIYTSEFIPIDAFNNYVVEVATIENDEEMTGTCAISPPTSSDQFEQELWENFEIQIKLKVDVEYNGSHDNGDPHNYSYIFTYDVADGNVVPVSTGPFITNIAGSNSDFLQYPENLMFGTTTFDGSTIAGCKLVGNIYTCQAWNNIEVNGDINTTPAYEVNFIAGNQIDIMPEAIVSPQSTFSIQQLLDYSNPMPEALEEYVSGFCAGTNLGLPSYKGNLPAKTQGQSLPNSGEEALLSNEGYSWDFNIFPNPANESTTIRLSGDFSAEYKIAVYDMTGKLMLNHINRNEIAESELNLQSISKGIYFVNVSTLQGTKTKQLIIK